MSIWITIPTGQRAAKAKITCEKWRNVGIAIAAYAWDIATVEAIDDICNLTFPGSRESFAKLQNRMIRVLFKNYSKCDAIICGADDLWPGANIDRLSDAVEKAQGKILWIYDGVNKDVPTHPVITRKWFERQKGNIFDEHFTHNCCDHDLYDRAYLAGEIVFCPQITFDHRHPLITKEPLDEIYKIGYDSAKADLKKLAKKWILFKDELGDMQKLKLNVPVIHV